MNEFEKFSPELKKDQPPKTSADFRAWLMENLGEKLEGGDYERIIVHKFDDNSYISVEIGKIEKVSSGEFENKPIEVRIKNEQAALINRISWDDLDIALKKSVMDKIKETEFLDVMKTKTEA